MAELAPHVKAYADELLACAPDDTPEQQRLIQRLYLPVMREIRAQAVPAA